VDISKAHVIDVQTAWTYILLNNGDRVFGNNCSGAKEALPVSIEDVALGQNGDYDFLYTSTDAFFAPGAFEQFAKSDTPAFCDFSSNWTQKSLKAGCEIFSHVAISCSDMSLIEVKSLLKKCVEDGAKLAIGTMGMNGSYVYNGRKFYYQEAHDSKVVDTLGAGDSFLAMFATSYFDGLKELDSCTKLLRGFDGMILNIQECEDSLIRKSMSFAALYAAKTCQNHGAFGHEIPFDYSMVARSDCDYKQVGRIS
jgi:fructoselysine 6-kinase